MKKSLRYLPEEKRRDLLQLVEIIRSEINDCEMIILYGSYARGTYVDYDQRTEFGVRTYFMSDYDILILTEQPVQKRWAVYRDIKEAYFQDKAIEFHTNPQFIDETVQDFNKEIEKCRYFYTDIKKQGVMLYNSGKYKLSRCRKLNYTEIEKIAQEYFDKIFARADSFLLDVPSALNRGDCIQASFYYHQASENYIRLIPLVYALYGYKEHDLAFLINKAKTHTLEICKVFPRDTEEEKRLFELLQNAYVQARYNKDFVVTREDIEALKSHIEKLRDIVAQSCRNRIAEYHKLRTSGKVSVEELGKKA